MASVKRFEELVAWQKARVLCNAVYAATNSGKFSKDFALRDQIRKSAISVMSNIAEGFERNGDKEFFYFLSIAKASAGELRTQLYIAFDQDYISKEDFDISFKTAEETSKIIWGLMSYIAKSSKTGKTETKLERTKSHLTNDELSTFDIRPLTEDDNL